MDALDASVRECIRAKIRDAVVMIDEAEETKIPKQFIEWACSQSGCDGGNLGAPIWFCGIEWGAGSYENGKYYREDLAKEIANGAAQPPSQYNWAEHLTYPYGRSLAKLYTAIHGESVDGYRGFVKYRQDNDIYKLNLYPIAFDSTDQTLWAKNKLDKLTGFDEKHLFQTWCYFNRFPFYADLVSQHSPKIIIGTGVSYLRDFMVCFGGEALKGSKIQYGEINPAFEANSRFIRRYYWVKLNSGETTLFVIPFFSGRYGLNSNYLLQKMGSAIKKIGRLAI